MADMMFALGQTKKKKKEENKVRQTKAELKDVVITDTIEKDIRKGQFDRDQKWKATGRDQIKRNTNFDMARSLFGGTSSVNEPARGSDEGIEKKMGSMRVRDHQEDEDEDEVDEQEVQEEEDDEDEYEEEEEVEEYEEYEEEEEEDEDEDDEED
mmetsp:Transcript_3733/g.9876  ORF Transcript_3733/g.9876 Transcript_3733/m.9876 type:complete len:154 (-) Transcript_3733:319-780(-)|eukprot:CAMPEP_0198116146 /NCGR_PEP_ID=MMETSP1442-20131203/9729_1 /TAXON_ID= /ORGANISM="Craspedostauros australis, Strain CCMP3328" /LENGTH=153 /DNA_ID=CAMNT_0043773857 /DNA_START=289 /DNA_END=750 /DNA_ORIENTATION=-